jgi:hypothetical protein
MTAADESMTPALAELWSQFLDGALEAGQAAELEALLRADPASARLAGEHYVEHRLLSLALQREAPGRFVTATLSRMAEEGRSFSQRVQQRLTPLQPTLVPAPAPRRRTPAWFAPTAAAALIAIITAGSLLYTHSTRPAQESAPATLVATLVVADHCVWRGTPRETGERLASGELELAAGTALVRCDGGAELLLSGAVAVRLESGGSAACSHGSVTVRAAKPVAGFILRTPVAEISDLGTEFAVTVGDGGITEVQVLEGGVEWRSRSAAAADPGTLLHQGQAVRVRSAEDRIGEPLPVTAVRLDAQLERIETGAPNAALISYDGFSYGFPTTISRRKDANGGTGWRSAWFRSQQSNDLVIDFTPDASLAMPDDLLPARGGRMELPSEPERPGTYREACMRLFAQPIAMARDGVRYVSLLVCRSAVASGPTHWWFRCMLTSEMVPDDRIGFGILSNGCPELMSHFGNSKAEQPIVDGRPYLFVFKLVTGRRSPDQAFLKVYGQHDAIDMHEPSSWTVAGVPCHFDGVLGSIHINNGTERAYSVDELRIGMTWQSVTPRRNTH